MVSEDNIGIVRRACEAWDRGDISVYWQMYAEDATAYAGRLAPEVVGKMQGPEEIITTLESLRGSVAESRLVLGDIIDRGDLLVVEILMRGRPHGSEKWIEWPLSVVYRFRDGRITHQAWYESHDEALAAAGLTGA